MDIHRIGQVPQRLVSKLSNPRRFNKSTAYCLLYCCCPGMTITRPLYQPDATVAHPSGGGAP
jgi:hypothetical protein